MDPLLQVVLILIVAKVFGELVERSGYPSLIGEIGAGVVLGPSLLHLIEFNPTIEFLANIGIVVLLFISGIETNAKQLFGARTVSTSTALAGVAIPFGMGALLGTVVGLAPLEALFVAITLSITSIGISVRTLIDLRQLNTPMGVAIVGAAVLDDIIGIIMLALLTSFALGQAVSPFTVLYTVTVGIVFLILMATIGRRVMTRIFGWTRGMHTHGMPYSVALILALLVALLSNVVNLSYAIGAFIAGLLLGDEIRGDRMLLDSLIDVSFGFFVTFFFVSVGLLITLSAEMLTSPLILPLIGVAIVSKTLGGYLGSLRFMRRRAEALIVGFGLCPRGEIALVAANIALIAGLISRDLYSSVAIMVLATALITPVLIQKGISLMKRGDHSEAADDS